MNLIYVLIIAVLGLVVAYKLKTKADRARYMSRGWKRLI
jgi:hypothetical protein